MKGKPQPTPPYWAHDGEDVLAYSLLKRLGIRSRTAVEFGGHDGYYKSNTAFFRDALSWRSIMFDLEPRSDLVIQAQITAENINAVFESHGVPRDVDVVSIDVDGNDLWIWKALEYRPSLVIIEYNPRWRPIRRRTIPYDPNRGVWDRTEYYGASAGALVALGQEKGYDLVASTNGNLLFAPSGVLPAMPVSAVKQRKKKEKLDTANRAWVGYP